jgi:type IV secretion system protein VirD4
MAGYGIRALLIAQSLNQIEKAYGPNNSILDNSHLRITYGTLDDRTAKRISEMLGTATESKRQTNYAGHRLAPWLGHVMVSEQESARPLLTPGEVLQFPESEALVMVGGNPPYRGLKVKYYQDKRFMNRIKLPRPDTDKLQTNELTGLGSNSAWLSFTDIYVEPEQNEVVSGTANGSIDVMGGVLLDGDVDKNPERGIQRDIPQYENIQPKSVAVDDQEVDKKEFIDQEQQATRNKQMDRQRTIELSRSHNGGDMPL